MADDELTADASTFPTPYPQMTGIGPVDVESVRQWMDDKDEWEVANRRRYTA
jgi:hypothetical protein